MKAMLLAAGRSTRLGAIGQALPKPLVPICGYPAIRFGLTACARGGLRDIVVNLHHQGELIRAVLADGRDLGVRVAYSDEPEILGTGGGIAQARTLLGDGDVLVMNAKVVADLDLTEVIAAHTASGADATLVLRHDPDPGRWGAIATDATGQVVRILDAESPRAPQGPVTEWMFTGVQVMGRRIRDRLRPVFCDSVRDAYMPALSEGADIRAAILPGYFAEHSTPERYLAGNIALLRAPDQLRASPGPLVGRDPAARVDVTARLIAPYRIEAGATVEARATVGPDAVVGTGARVASGAHLRRAVVWSGATAEGDVADAIVTGTGVVSVSQSRTSAP